MPLRATWFFYDPGFSQGWTETLFQAGNAYLNTMAKAKAYAKKRINLCGDGIRIKYIRVSDDSIKGDVLPYYTAGQSEYIAGAVAGHGGGNNDPDVPWTTINARCLSGTSLSKFMFLRGVPDRIEVNPPGPKVFDDPLYMPAWTAWKSEVITAQWCWLTQEKVADNAMGTVISAVGATGRLTVTTAAAHGLVVGDRVAFRKGRRATPTFTGIHQVIDVPVGNIFVIPTTFTGTAVFVSLPRFFKQTFTTAQIEDIIVAAEGRRAPGRPFGQRPGKRKAAKANALTRAAGS